MLKNKEHFTPSMTMCSQKTTETEGTEINIQITDGTVFFEQCDMCLTKTRQITVISFSINNRSNIIAFCPGCSRGLISNIETINRIVKKD